MPKSRTPSKEISTRGVLKKVRKPLAPPSRVHTERKKYRRSRVRIDEETDGAGSK
jgi:hypothetical protein